MHLAKQLRGRKSMVRFPDESVRFSPLSRPCQLWDSYNFLLNVYVEVFLAREQSLTIELHILPRLGVCTVLLQPLSIPL
jgi:hypothetical protein